MRDSRAGVYHLPRGRLDTFKYHYNVSTHCMAIKVQFRESDEAIAAYVIDAGLNANELAREAFEEKVRGMMARARRESLANRRLKLPAGSGARWTREEREA